ncbi:LADA_0E12178g1_1 [Lachancea dasiensis]|uniref:LADA_0E12178g1_1 n=1 Tax=Lachancea dasiensis TaxID=1072105 RepID=A0A1G4JF14_9SACH|nr:LADA_0E12178g1_1 [Lachancea dasiensis]
MGVVDNCLHLLIHAHELDTTQIHEILTKIHASVNREGVSAELLDQFIVFLCETSRISVSTKIFLVREALLPNGKIPDSTVHTVIKYLGVTNFSTSQKQETPRSLQTELCKWLVHVYLYMEDVSVFERTYSVWFHLWSLDYLQIWITYLLFWSTSRYLAKPWRMKVHISVGNNPGYSNSRATATLLLHKYYNIHRHSSIARAITNLKCNARRLKTIQQSFWDHVFLIKWCFVLELSNSISSASFHVLVNELETKLRCQPSKEWDDKPIPLKSIETLENLSQHFGKISFPNDIDAILTKRDRNSLVFLATADSTNDLWDRVLQWFQLKQNYQPSKGRLHESDVRYRHGMMAAWILNPKCLSSPIIIQSEERGPSNILMLLGLLCKFEMVENIANSMTHMQCRGILAMICTFSKGLDVERAAMYFSAIKDFLEQEAFCDLHDGNLAVTFRLFVKVLRERIATTNSTVLSDSWLFSQKFLTKLIISNDPILLDSVSEYLILSREGVVNSSRAEVSEMHNTIILDLTNYLWRNKLSKVGSMLMLPTCFIRILADIVFQVNSHVSEKRCFNLLNIPALSFVGKKAVERLEDALGSEARFHGAISEKGFLSFKLKVGTDKWLDTITNFYELKLAVLAKIRYEDAYGNISLFLYTYLRSLTNSEDI